MKRLAAQTIIQAKASNRKSFLHLILVITLVLLPIQGLMADMPVVDSGNATSKNMTSGYLPMDVSVHQHDDHHVVSNAGDFSFDCHGHETACGASCAPFVQASFVVLEQIVMKADACQHFHVPLSVVVLASEIRPPIS